MKKKSDIMRVSWITLKVTGVIGFAIWLIDHLIRFTISFFRWWAGTFADVEGIFATLIIGAVICAICFEFGVSAGSDEL